LILSVTGRGFDCDLDVTCPASKPFLKVKNAYNGSLTLDWGFSEPDGVLCLLFTNELESLCLSRHMFNCVFAVDVFAFDIRRTSGRKWTEIVWL
jgi:hypothetical protein